jgi:hypothetical protein
VKRRIIAIKREEQQWKKSNTRKREKVVTRGEE